ncbi:MAG: efflux RND transporter periplasmic adaptor subunit [Proteobacteria bacterium]|nr:efflux RND transporter periplasmic adaptor subunit [Pseudomonadota bacterium]
MRRQWLALGGAALAAVLGAACGEEVVVQEEVARPVRILEIGSGTAGGTNEYSGVVAAWQHAEMAFEVPGRITDFLVIEGQRVAEGEVLAKLDPRDYEAELAKAVANAKKTAADHERYRIMYEKGVSPQIEMETAQRRHEVSLASLAQAEKAVEDTVLVAPFAGVAARKLVKDFQNVKAKEPVLIVQDATLLKMVVAVPEADLAGRKSQDGLEVVNARIKPRVIVSSLPDRVFPAKIRELATAADPTTRTFDATFAFENDQDAVLPGMTARLIIDLPGDHAGASSGLRIPSQAVFAGDDGGSLVWKVDPQTMRVSRSAVDVGSLSGDNIEIRAGLSSGDWVVSSGVQQLQDGMTVRRF